MVNPVTVPVIPMCIPCFGVSPAPECQPRTPRHDKCNGWLTRAYAFSPDGERIQVPCNCAANDHIGVTA